jgi:hypothetical protein
MPSLFSWRSSFAFFLFLHSSSANAFGLDWSPSDMSLADVSTVHPDSMGAIRWNPAVLALLPRYQIGAGAFIDQDLNWEVGAAAMDSTEGPIAMGLLVTRRIAAWDPSPDDRPGWKLPEQEFSGAMVQSLIGGSLGISFGNRAMGLGIGGFYRNDVTDYDLSQHAVELNTGFGFRVWDQLIVGLSAEDLLNRSNGRALDTGIRWGPLEPSMAAGLPAKYQDLPFRSMGGLELDARLGLEEEAFLDWVGCSGDVLVADYLSVRGGWKWSNVEKNSLFGFGLGLDSENAIIEYALELSVDGGFQHMHSIGLRLRL